jgi:hypothetical protein
MTKLTKSEAIAAMIATEGDLRQKALKEAGGIWPDQATKLGKILDRLGLSERRQYGRRELIVPLDRALAAIGDLQDPLEVPLQQRCIDYVVVYVPNRNGTEPFDVGSRVPRRALVDILNHYAPMYDGLEFERFDVYYRLYHATLYLIDGGELDRDAGHVIGGDMVATEP